MSNGKEIASFEYQSTSITLTTLPGGARQFQLNMEGKVSGAWEATALMTMTATTNDMQNGTYEATVAGYLADGGVVTGEGSGTTQSLGGHKWRVCGQGLTSDGQVLSTDGEMDLASRTYKGKVFA